MKNQTHTETKAPGPAAATRCCYVNVWTNRLTGERRKYTCGRVIDPDRLPPYRRGQGVCHRHERGLAGLLGQPRADGWPGNPDGCAWQPVRSARKGVVA